MSEKGKRTHVIAEFVWEEGVDLFPLVRDAVSDTLDKYPDYRFDDHVVIISLPRYRQFMKDNELGPTLRYQEKEKTYEFTHTVGITIADFTIHHSDMVLDDQVLIMNKEFIPFINRILGKMLEIEKTKLKVQIAKEVTDTIMNQ